MNRPADFDAFWERTLTEAAQFPLAATFTAVSTSLKLIEPFDVRFAGFGGQSIAGWLLLPAGQTEPLPCMVEYLGYGSGRGRPFERLLWVNAGYAYFVMDTRGQGLGWSGGLGHSADTPDGGHTESHAAFQGLMTRGILQPEQYYYRRLYVDAVRAVAAVQTHPLVDNGRLALLGHSQGGGVALAVAGLLRGVITAVLADTPFLCDIKQGVYEGNSEPYEEIRRFCQVLPEQVDAVFQTVAYVDALNFVPQATAAALFSLGEQDPVSLPQTVRAAFALYGGKKTLVSYRFNGHEGGGSTHRVKQLTFLQQLWEDV